MENISFTPKYLRSISGLHCRMTFLIMWVVPLLSYSELKAQNINIAALEEELLKEKKDSLWVLKAIHYTRQMHRHNDQEKKEYTYAQKAVSRALQLNDTLLYARALDNMGLLYRYHQWYAQAVPLHIKAYNLIANKPVKDLYKMIFANNAGVAARYNQQYSLSVSYYLKALGIANRNNNLKNIAISSNGLGNAISNIPGREDEALSYFKKALSAETRLNDSLGMAMDLLSISDYYIQKKHYQKALDYLNQLLEINQKRKDAFGLAITNEFFGHTYFNQGTNLKKAADYYLKALNQYRSIDDILKSATVLHSLGNIHFQSGQLKKALQYFNYSMEVADSFNNKSLIMKNAFRISNIKEKQGHFASALTFYKKAKSYEDSINIEQQKIRITALNNKYNLSEKEEQISLLQKEQALTREKIKVQQDEIKARRTHFILLLIGVTITIIFVVIQYHNRKAKRQAELKLREKEKDLLKAEYEKNLAQAEIHISRMQINPHFIFNCLNAINALIQKQETKKASQYLITFSRFIRMILEMPKNETISLSEELKLIRYYLTLEEKRFGQEIHFSIDTCAPNKLAHIRIPPLLLQPFVENAIWHGLLPSNKKKKNLHINVTDKGGTIEISIDDNGVGRKIENVIAENEGKKSLGMKITRERIRQFNESFGCQITLEIIDKHPQKGTTILLTLQDPKSHNII